MTKKNHEKLHSKIKINMMPHTHTHPKVYAHVATPHTVNIILIFSMTLSVHK